MSEYKFSILIPAYNEELTIGTVLSDLQEKYKNIAEIIVINDGSTDNTSQIVMQYPHVRLITHRHNYGYGASLKTGVLEASTNIVCFFDADGQHDPDDIMKLYNKCGQVDMVVGSRGLKAFSNIHRAPGKLFLHLLANYLSGRKIPDLNSGLRLIRRDLIKNYLHLLPNGFSASTTTTMIMLCRNYEVLYENICVKQRKGKSQIKQIRDGHATILTILRTLLLFNPMKFFTPFSVFFCTIGFIYSGYKLLDVGLGLPVGGLLIIFVGLLGFIFGLLCDQIASIRLEKYEDPDSYKSYRLSR